MKLYHITAWADENPVIVANSAIEAGKKYIAKYKLPYVLLHGDADTASFADILTIPKKWAEPQTPEFQNQNDGLCQFFVEPVCLGEKRCVDCASYRQDGITISLFEDVKLIASLLAKGD